MVAYLIFLAISIAALIVTNDRFRDWVERFPVITDPGHLIQGRYQQGDVKAAD